MMGKFNHLLFDVKFVKLMLDSVDVIKNKSLQYNDNQLYIFYWRVVSNNLIIKFGML